MTTDTALIQYMKEMYQAHLNTWTDSYNWLILRKKALEEVKAIGTPVAKYNSALAGYIGAKKAEKRSYKYLIKIRKRLEMLIWSA